MTTKADITAAPLFLSRRADTAVVPLFGGVAQAVREYRCGSRNAPPGGGRTPPPAPGGHRPPSRAGTDRAGPAGLSGVFSPASTAIGNRFSAGGSGQVARSV